MNHWRASQGQEGQDPPAAENEEESFGFDDEEEEEGSSLKQLKILPCKCETDLVFLHTRRGTGRR